jgi:hypothetical protein
VRDRSNIELACIELDDEDLSAVSAGKFKDFADFDSIKGESTDDRHRGEIQLENWTLR